MYYKKKNKKGKPLKKKLVCEGKLELWDCSMDEWAGEEYNIKLCVYILICTYVKSGDVVFAGWWDAPAERETLKSLGRLLEEAR